ncbi:hypothetical protein [Gimesia aquarii]|uniref:Uncharacterized protein n=1 Tax=Gimesia aquarii TaxID=2527964 RepID=A0A517W1T3_9PLAN|nr:hypothetical protein [Gimesia aquarii]QDT99210.1 hypothetical protein V144x_47210 [Gimesia aquarii]
MNTKYLNTDLDLKSYQEITLLGKYFDKHADLIRCENDDGVWWAVVEDSHSNRNALPTDNINNLLDVIQNLEPDLKAILDTCHVKDFNIGIETGNIHGFNLGIDHATLKRIVDLNFTISFTTYPNCDE